MIQTHIRQIITARYVARIFGVVVAHFRSRITAGFRQQAFICGNCAVKLRVASEKNRDLQIDPWIHEAVATVLRGKKSRQRVTEDEVQDGRRSRSDSQPGNPVAAELWPRQEARRLAERVAAYEPARSGNFQSGFGPSGLPHLGTMAEILRPSFVRKRSICSSRRDRRG